jgi:hypothetical protein
MRLGLSSSSAAGAPGAPQAYPALAQDDSEARARLAHALRAAAEARQEIARMKAAPKAHPATPAIGAAKTSPAVPIGALPAKGKAAHPASRSRSARGQQPGAREPVTLTPRAATKSSSASRRLCGKQPAPGPRPSGASPGPSAAPKATPPPGPAQPQAIGAPPPKAAAPDPAPAALDGPGASVYFPPAGWRVPRDADGNPEYDRVRPDVDEDGFDEDVAGGMTESEARRRWRDRTRAARKQARDWHQYQIDNGLVEPGPLPPGPEPAAARGPPQYRDVGYRPPAPLGPHAGQTRGKGGDKGGKGAGKRGKNKEVTHYS